jgi:phage shock protein E
VGGHGVPALDDGALVGAGVRAAQRAVEGALLLPLSDLRDKRGLWKNPLADARGRELVLYCRSGNRSGIAAGILEKEGWTVWNAGGFSAWMRDGQKVVKP